MRVVFLFLLILLLPIIGFVTLVQSTPDVDVSASQQVDHADTVKQLLDQLGRSIKERHAQHTLIISENQFASVVGLVQRARDEIKGEVALESDGSIAKVTVELPSPLDGYFLNLETKLLPGNSLSFDYFRIGDLYIPGEFGLSMLEFITNQYTHSDIATQAIASVSAVKMDEQTLTLTMKPLHPLLTAMRDASANIGGDRDEELEALTAYYLAYFHDHSVSRDTTPVSVSDYLSVGMALAKRQSNERDAYRHNQAVILALAAYIGHQRISPLIGDIQPIPSRPLQPVSHAEIAGRNDLARHFILSAAIQLLSERGVSLAIGEFKELMDRAIGGSGYSFVDLAADMAGMEFAQVSTDQKTAQAVQRILASNASERTFFPSILGLPEGISKRDFERDYYTVDSPQYLAQVDDIKGRIAQVPLYSLAF